MPINFEAGSCHSVRIVTTMANFVQAFAGTPSPCFFIFHLSIAPECDIEEVVGGAGTIGWLAILIIAQIMRDLRRRALFFGNFPEIKMF